MARSAAAGRGRPIRNPHAVRRRGTSGEERNGSREGSVQDALGNDVRAVQLDVEALRPVAERLGITLAQLALAWNVHQPGVTAAIAGSRNPDHVRSNAAAGDVELDDATLSELDAIVSRAAPA